MICLFIENNGVTSRRSPFQFGKTIQVVSVSTNQLEYDRSRFDRIVREKWSKLTEEERAPYVRMTEEDDERFNTEMGEKVKTTSYAF